MISDTLSFPAAFFTGLLSFFSPCILPLLPAYFTFITGLSLDALTHEKSAGTRLRIVLATLSYVLGFSAVFVVMGASASYMGNLVFNFRDELRIIGGLVVIVMGLHMMGMLRIGLMEGDFRVQVRKTPLHLAGVFVVGMAFGAGWTPCVGPLLGSMLILAGTQDSVYTGMALLSVYASGLAIPFLVFSVFADSLLRLMKKIALPIKYTSRIAGGLLVGVGLILIIPGLHFFKNL
ncbi:cytochrome c biogenesis protein CcdA [Desulfosarcina sp. OttesenSCG-928-A07]|nr:cytochrome c biogenesis protein CcdA [Desulfosarcina sp. OttesenSCG-928-G17]MDL2328865.1 cytochrome c biogenesis protein CcdA [Desulfosarcina sp. OttesenSCG-928-A07]